MLAVVSRLAAAGCVMRRVLDTLRALVSASGVRIARGLGRIIPETAHVDDLVRRQRSELDRRGLRRGRTRGRGRRRPAFRGGDLEDRPPRRHAAPTAFRARAARAPRRRAGRGPGCGVRLAGLGLGGHVAWGGGGVAGGGIVGDLFGILVAAEQRSQEALLLRLGDGAVFRAALDVGLRHLIAGQRRAVRRQMHGAAIREQLDELLARHARPGAHVADVEMHERRARGRVVADAAALQPHRGLAELLERNAGDVEVDGLAERVLAVARDAGALAAAAEHFVGAGRAVAADDLDRLLGADLLIDLPEQIDLLAGPSWSASFLRQSRMIQLIFFSASSSYWPFFL